MFSFSREDLYLILPGTLRHQKYVFNLIQFEYREDLMLSFRPCEETT